MISVCTEKVKLAGRWLCEASVILGTGCFDAGIKLFIPPITLLFPVVFITLAGRFGKNVIAGGVIFNIL